MFPSSPHGFHLEVGYQTLRSYILSPCHWQIWYRSPVIKGGLEWYKFSSPNQTEYTSFLCFLFTFSLFWNWNTVDLQCCVIFCSTEKFWFSYTHIYIISYILFHYGLSWDIEYSSLCYTVQPYCLSILYIIVSDEFLIRLLWSLEINFSILSDIMIHSSKYCVWY